MKNLEFSRIFLFLKKSGNSYQILLGFGVFFTKSFSDNLILFLWNAFAKRTSVTGYLNQGILIEFYWDFIEIRSIFTKFSSDNLTLFLWNAFAECTSVTGYPNRTVHYERARTLARDDYD